MEFEIKKKNSKSIRDVKTEYEFYLQQKSHLKKIWNQQKNKMKKFAIILVKDILYLKKNKFHMKNQNIMKKREKNKRRRKDGI